MQVRWGKEGEGGFVGLLLEQERALDVAVG